MKTKAVRKLLLAASLASAIGLSGSNALANSAASIETQASGTAATYDDNGSGNFPIVTAILSAPSGSVYNPGASLDGYTYNNWSYLAADTTGSMDIFYSKTAAGPLANYPLPTVGDTILVQGTYSPFDGIPEIENGSAQAINVFGPGSSGNAPYNPVPVLTAIPTINVGTTGPNGTGINSSGLAGDLLQLNNVTISDVYNSTAGTSSTFISNWATHANNQGIITDGSGNSMVMYLWASSYSTCGAIAAAGGAIPTGQVDMAGFVDDFYSSSTGITEAEFVPVSIISVPEPTTLCLCGAGGLLMLALRRRSAFNR